MVGWGGVSTARWVEVYGFEGSGLENINSLLLPSNEFNTHA